MAPVRQLLPATESYPRRVAQVENVVWFRSQHYIYTCPGAKAGVTDPRIKSGDHTAVDYAQVLMELSDIHFPKAKKIRLVQDNLNTHTKASLYPILFTVPARFMSD